MDRTTLDTSIRLHRKLDSCERVSHRPRRRVVDDHHQRDDARHGPPQFRYFSQLQPWLVVLSIAKCCIYFFINDYD